MVIVGVQLISKPAGMATGIGRYAAEVARGLRDVGIASREAALRSRAPTILQRAGHWAGYDVDAFLRSYPIRADVRPGYITHLTSQTLAMLLLTQRLPRPIVVTVHDILPYLLRDDPDLCVYRNRVDRLMDGLAMRALRRADRLIAVSDYTKRTVVDTFGINPGRVDVVHNGVDCARFRPLSVPQQFRERYALPPDRTYVLYVGSEDPRKNVPFLLAAIAQVRRNAAAANVTLLKVGSAAFDNQRARHERLCRELGIADAVRWLDQVPEADLPLFYNVAHVVTLPSRYEGFGLPVLEALACGRPVVALRSCSIPELVGNAATLVDAADAMPFAAAIEQAIGRHDDAVPERIAQARRFTWQRTVRGLADVYARLGSKHAA